MGIIVIVAYRPKSGKEEALLELMKTHVPTLRAEGLVTELAPITMLAKDGSIVEVFEWASKDAIEAAHSNQVVAEMWAKFEQVCEYVPIGEVEGADAIFSEFAPLPGT